MTVPNFLLHLWDFIMCHLGQHRLAVLEEDGKTMHCELCDAEWEI